MSKKCSDNPQELLAGIMYWAKTNGIEIDTAVFFVNMEIEEMIKTKFNPGGPVAMYESEESGISPLMFLSDLLRLLKNGQKSDSFAAHFEQHFHTTTSRTDLRKYMAFKAVKQLSPADAIKTFTKPNCNICMEELLTTLKNLRDKRVTIMNKNSEIYGACQHKTCFQIFCLSTDDPVLNG